MLPMGDLQVVQRYRDRMSRVAGGKGETVTESWCKQGFRVPTYLAVERPKRECC